MKLLSLSRSGAELIPVEVEINLTPGLPQISFLGLPDAGLKESVQRIKSALREQGFQLPPAHQVLVQLRPSYLRKSSRGLDLAVAVGVLLETGQISIQQIESFLKNKNGPSGTLFFYGELTLKGELLLPDDSDEGELPVGAAMVTGPQGISPDDSTKLDLPFTSLRLFCLRDFLTEKWQWQEAVSDCWRRPEVQIKEFPSAAAELGMVIAAGEHSALIAGPPGGGKSTLVDCVGPWLEEPNSLEFRKAKRFNRKVGRDLSWRPILKPHHSITPMAMIGGGSSVWAGEITRAHAGVLIMDELLEYNPVIQEALREPLEAGTISISRAGASKTFPASLLLLATTNLCPCGRFVPRRGEERKCRCLVKDRRKMISRLKGPFVDRFTIFSLSDGWTKDEKNISTKEIYERVLGAVEFRKKRNQWMPNAKLDPAAIEESLTPFQKQHFIVNLRLPRRRKMSSLRVARTLADLEKSELIQDHHLQRAMHYCVETFRMIEEWEG